MIPRLRSDVVSETNSHEGRRLRAVGLVGSLRAGSLNRRLMSEAQRLAPPELFIEVFERIGDLPHYNADIEPEPSTVTELKEMLAHADAIVIASPEYNFSIPGVLKNALDWASTPPGRSAMTGLPVAIMGASPGMLGTARAQQQLRSSLIFTRNPVVTSPEVLVANASDKFDVSGRITDPLTERVVQKLLLGLVDLIRRHA